MSERVGSILVVRHLLALEPVVKNGEPIHLASGGRRIAGSRRFDFHIGSIQLAERPREGEREAGDVGSRSAAVASAERRFGNIL
jgi:hypothetical protein